MAVESFLPPVVTRLSMNLDDYAAGIAKAKALMDSYKQSVQDANNALRDQQALLSADNQSITSQSRRLATATAWQDKFKNAVQETNNALRGQAVAATAASVANVASAGGTNSNGRFGPWWMRLIQGDTSLWAGLFGSKMLVGSIHAWHVALDGAVEAAVALTGSVIDLTGAAVVMAPAALDIANRLSAISSVSNALDANIPPLTGRFRDLAQQVAGPTIGAYGGLLQLLNGNGGAGQVFVQTADALSGYIAKIDLWKSSQQQTNSLVQHGQGYLSQFGAIVASTGVALVNIARSDPGTVHVLLGIAQGAAQVVQTISKVPPSILKTTIALHSAWLWGGLAATGIAKVIKPAQKLIGLFSVEGAAAFGSAVPLIGGVAVAAMILGNAWGSATNAVSRYVTAQNQAVGTMSPEQFINNLPSLIKGLNDTTAKATVSLPRTLAGLRELGQGLFTSNFGKIAGGVGNSVAGFFTNPIGSFNPSSQVAAEVGAWQKQWTGLISKSGNLVGVLANLTRQGFSTQDAFGLMSLAGVKAGDSFALMNQKVKNLIAGYGDLGTNAGFLTNAINATSFAAEQQQSRITAVTQGFTAFISTVTGGLSNFVTFQQGMATLSTDSKAAGASMTGLDAASLSLQGQWATQINQASTLVNSLYQLDSAGQLGARGQQLLAQASKAAVAEMLPMAKNSTVARDSLYALAQQGGYRGADSIKALAGWMDKAKNPAKDLQAAMAALTTPASNLARDVTNLANAIDPSMTGAMAGAIMQATGGTKALENLASAVINGTGGMKGLQGGLVGVWRQMRTVYQNTAQARDMFITFANRLGITQGAAERLWNDLQASGGKTSAAVLRDIAAIQNALNALHGKTVTITVQAIGNGLSLVNTGGSGVGSGVSVRRTAGGLKGFASGTSGAAPGWAWVGEVGPELVRFRGGESVIPHNVARGYAMGTGDETVHEINVYLDGKQIYRGMQQQSITTQRRTGHNGLSKRSR